MTKAQEIKKKVDENRENIVNFMREIVAIPSMRVRSRTWASASRRR